MKLGIMQPYFFPYIGYFQLMNTVDEYIVYDNIEYTKKGWINRNRILIEGKPCLITLPLKNDHDNLQIKDRFLASDWAVSREELLRRIIAAYRKAPLYDAVFPLVEKILLDDSMNLFTFLARSLYMIKGYLGIETPLLISSTIPINHNLRSEDKVIAFCKARNADMYINPIGGTALYNRDRFEKEGIDLRFVFTDYIQYKQFGDDFVSSLSILDVMMFNTVEKIKEFLNAFILVKGKPEL
jgi:hypothetical protein